MDSKPCKCFRITLDDLEREMALQLGDGDVALGVRRALVLTAIRDIPKARERNVSGAAPPGDVCQSSPAKL